MNKTFFNNINNWDDFDNKLSSFGNKEKGDAFELLTKCYFKIKEIYQDYDNVWLLDELPQKELDYLKIPSQDLGIDLIAKKGDEYHAIQCKYHGDSSQNITFKEVSTFLQQVESNKKITMGYICSSANGTSKNYQKVQKKDIQEILADSWQLLDKAFFDNIRRILNDKPVKNAKPFEPRKHQEKAINQAVNYFVKENNTRGKLIFPCGAGKSLTGYWLSEALESKSTIIAVPSLSLVKQTLEVYLREIVANGIKVKWLCICSDEGIGASDDVAIMTNNIGVPCKTDPEYIRAWLKENKDEHKIIFTTYQSGHLIADISKKLKLSFDLGIFDEAHKTVGSNLKKFSYLLFEKNIKIDKRIFMTATERFYSGSKEDIISMDDEDVYGDTFAQMSFKEAIDLDLLTDYKVITIDIKKSEIAEFIKDNNLVQLNSKWKKETEARSLASMLAMRKAMKQFNIKNVVSFHSSIEKAKRNKELQQYITDTYNYKPIDTFTVSGKIPTTKRNVIVQEFAKSDRALITNARCLTEGIDVPNIDCIVFADPRKSKVDIVQALGRALRKKEGKEWGYVILPVVYDGDTNEIDNDSFNEIVSIVRGLASNDERIVEYFKDKSLIGKGGSDIIKGSSLFSLDSSMLEEKDLANQLQIKIWEKLSKFQWTPFEEAREYVRSLGLKSVKEWYAFIKSGKLQNNIPHSPHYIYKDKGWNGIGDWVGTHKIADQFKEYLSFEDARRFMLDNNIKSMREWIKFRKENDIKNIPYKLIRTYSKEWISRPHFFGTANFTYQEAKKYIQKFNIPSMRDYYKFCKTKDYVVNLPQSPQRVYKDKGWVDWKEFLGYTKRKTSKKEYASLNEAKKILFPLKLTSSKEYFNLLKDQDFKSKHKLTTHPNRIYKDEGWKGFQDYLGYTDLDRKKKFVSYKECKIFALTMNVKSARDWYTRFNSKNRPENIPSNPPIFYKDCGWENWQQFLKEIKIPRRPENIYSEWTTWSDFLGHGRISDNKRLYMNFEEAKVFVSKLNLSSVKEWRLYCDSGKKPDDIPSSPHTNKQYKSKWKNWDDWLGNNNIKTIRSFKAHKKYAHSLNITSQSEWYKIDHPNDIVRSINFSKQYKDQWKGWDDFLGCISKRKHGFLPFKQARNFARNLKLKSRKEWNNTSIPNNIPRAPHSCKEYSDQWIDWSDWLGVKIISTNNLKYRPFNDARKFARNLGFKSQKSWFEYCVSGKKPDDIPRNVSRTYKKEGWAGWKDFLGNE